MMISAFTFGRNLLRACYPVRECIASVLPIVDEFVVNIDEGDNETIAAIEAMNEPKIRIVTSSWNPRINIGGYVLSQQTNIALFNCKGDWAIYLQADELIHERDHQHLVDLMKKHKDDDGVEGIVLRRLTFYNDAHTLSNVHPFAIDPVVRIVKPHRFVLSRGDAAGFTVHPKYKDRGRAVRAVDSGVDLFHYGPLGQVALQRKKKLADDLWQDEGTGRTLPEPYVRIPRHFVRRYEGSHPAPMAGQIGPVSEALDLDSPDWRRSMNFRERRKWLRTWLILNVSSIFNRRRDHRLVRT